MSPILHHRAERYERKNMPDGYRLTDEDQPKTPKQRPKAFRPDLRSEPIEDPYWVERQAETVTMAEEPIEVRLQRAWLNGFKEGVDRAAYATQEATGRWDY